MAYWFSKQNISKIPQKNARFSEKKVKKAPKQAIIVKIILKGLTGIIKSLYLCFEKDSKEFYYKYYYLNYLQVWYFHKGNKNIKSFMQGHQR